VVKLGLAQVEAALETRVEQVELLGHGGPAEQGILDELALLHREAFLGVEAAEVRLGGELALAEVGPALETRLPEADGAFELAVGDEELAACLHVLAVERALESALADVGLVEGSADQRQTLGELILLREMRPIEHAIVERHGAVEDGAVELGLAQEDVAQ